MLLINTSAANESKNHVIGKSQNVATSIDKIPSANENANQQGETVENIGNDSQNLENVKQCQDVTYDEVTKIQMHTMPAFLPRVMQICIAPPLPGNFDTDTS